MSRPLSIAAATCLLLAGCASNKPDTNELDRTLYLYAGAIRWSQIDDALGFIDPDKRAELALSPIERKRLDQLEVTGYHVQGSQSTADGDLLQIVEITLINRHTQVERKLIDRQRWHWDEAGKHWWLESGLPDFAPH